MVALALRLCDGVSSRGRGSLIVYGFGAEATDLKACFLVAVSFRVVAAVS